jgi:hypothetical protein
MIEVEDITKEYEYIYTQTPLVHGVNKVSVIEKAKEMWGENFKIGLFWEGYDKNTCKWVAVQIMEGEDYERVIK